MLEIIKYGTSKYGVWILGHLKYEGLDFYDIFSTNLSSEDSLKDKTTLKPKLFKISRSRQGKILFSLEF